MSNPPVTSAIVSSQSASRALITHASDVHTQNGEDGIIAALFSVIGTTTRLCCEFGAWDGIHLSNTRRLLLEGWRGLLIEADPVKFVGLQNTYAGNQRVVCLNTLVDDGANELSILLKRAGINDELDFLSIDIDGFDYYAFEAAHVRPRVVCVEVNAGHSPLADTLLPREVAANNIGQPLACFVRLGEQLGYRLVCYNGNAFFLRNDVGFGNVFPTLPAEAAYGEFLDHSSVSARRWLYLVNKGVAPPFFQFRNSYLTSAELKLSPLDTLHAQWSGLRWSVGRKFS